MVKQASSAVRKKNEDSYFERVNKEALAKLIEKKSVSSRDGASDDVSAQLETDSEKTDNV